MAYWLAPGHGRTAFNALSPTNSAVSIMTMVTPQRNANTSKMRSRSSFRTDTCTNMYAGKRLGESDHTKNKKGTKQKKRRLPAPGHFPKEGAKYDSGNKGEVNDPPRKGVIRMIAGGPIGEGSHHAQKLQIREAHDISLKEVLDVETMEDAPFIQFGRAERSVPKTSHNDSLVITALLFNYEVGRIFIDFGSFTNILFGEAYDQMQLGDIPLEKVNTSLYGFAGEVVHPRGMISLPLTWEQGILKRLAC
ncbi:UNVERIFIED_CONTAM: hypothetical protein Slati_2139900 [Sesamum latifolium]|uniref:Uncharacterized protein n=1 Tax=Sesamum latifolium TaxID=2727402 RepID=A0AAW2WR44_9LAMI